MTERLTAAIAAARAEPTPSGWFELSDQILGRVRLLVRPGVPVITFGPDGRSDRGRFGSRVFIAARVLQAAIRRAGQGPRRIVTQVALQVEDDVLTGVRIAMTADYGADLVETADQVRAATQDCIRGLVGSPQPVRVDVVVDDVR